MFNINYKPYFAQNKKTALKNVRKLVGNAPSMLACKLMQ